MVENFVSCKYLALSYATLGVFLSFLALYGQFFPFYLIVEFFFLFRADSFVSPGDFKVIVLLRVSPAQHIFPSLSKNNYSTIIKKKLSLQFI